MRRSVGALRGCLITPAGAALLAIVWRAWPSLRFVPSGVSNRITDYALATMLLAVAATGAALLALGLKWLLFWLWPGSLAIVADERELCIPTGPLRRVRLDWARMSARYSFEMSPDEDEDAFYFDSMMDEDTEPAARLPLLQHPACRGPVNYHLVRFAKAEENVLVQRLRPFVERIRQDDDAGH